MPYQNVMSLERFQAKTQAARGTPETTMTRWLYPIQGSASWTMEIPTDDAKEHLRGFHGTEAPTMGLSVSRINLETVMAYEEGVWWMNFILKGGARTGTSLGGSPVAYEYVFDPSSTSDDLDVFTMKAGDGTTNYTFDRCVVNRATFRWNPQSGGELSWRAAMEIWCRFTAAGVSMDAPSDIARTKIASIGTKLYSDGTGGTIGTTQVTGKVRSGSITIDNQLEEKAFTEDTSVMSADFARGEQIVTGELLYEFKDDTEFGYFRAGTRRQVRILQEGATISGSNKYSLRWDFKRAHIVSFRPGYTGQNKTATIGFVGEIDRAGSAPTPVTARFVNASATITA
jgi:hypothetical protein